MAFEADRNQVAVVICAAVSFRDDVVDRFCRTWSAAAQARLANVTITLKDADADNVPLTAVATFMAALTLLVLLPALIAMLLTVA